MSTLNLLSVWTVYDRPLDCPDGFVARRHEVRVGGVTVPTDDVAFGDTLAEVRAKLPPRLHRVPRDPKDNPSVVESWI